MDTVEVCQLHADEFNSTVGKLLCPVGIKIKCFIHPREYGARVVVQWEKIGELLCQSVLRIKDESQLHNTLLTEFLLFEKKRVKRMCELLQPACEEEDSQREEDSQADLNLYLPSQSCA